MFQDDASKKASDYDYLLGMSLWRLSEEEKNKLLQDSETKKTELRTLQMKTWSDLYEEDLVEFEQALDKQDKKEKADLEDFLNKAVKKAQKDDTTAGKRAGKKLTKGLAVSRSCCGRYLLLRCRT